MRILTVYQKLVLRLLAAILWRLVYKDAIDSGCFSDMGQKHSAIISDAQNELLK